MQNTNWNSETHEYRILGCTADANNHLYNNRTALETIPKDGDTLAIHILL